MTTLRLYHAVCGLNYANPQPEGAIEEFTSALVEAHLIATANGPEERARLQNQAEENDMLRFLIRSLIKQGFQLAVGSAVGWSTNCKALFMAARFQKEVSLHVSNNGEYLGTIDIVHYEGAVNIIRSHSLTLFQAMRPITTYRDQFYGSCKISSSGEQL